MRRLVLAGIAAWIAVWIAAFPSVANAQQQRGDGPGRPRGPAMDGGRGGGFSGMLNDIAGARLNRAHVDRRDRSERMGPGRGPGGGGGGGFGRGAGGGGGGGGRGDRGR